MQRESKILWVCFCFLNAGCLESRHNAFTAMKNLKLTKMIFKIKGNSQLKIVPLGKGPTRDTFHSDLEPCPSPLVPFARFQSEQKGNTERVAQMGLFGSQNLRSR